MDMQIIEGSSGRYGVLTESQRRELALLSERGEYTAVDLQAAFHSLIIPLIEKFSGVDPEPGTPYYFDFHHFLFSMKRFFLGSHRFEGAAKRFIQDPAHAPRARAARSFVGWAAGRVESYANGIVCETLSRLGSDAARLQLICDLSRFGTRFHDPILQHERIPQIELEMTVSGGGPESRVLIVGSGPLPVTGLAWAARGANVVLVDRDPHAFTYLDRLLTHLPESMRTRISTRRAEVSELNIEECSPTHVLLAGMLDAKVKLMEKFSALPSTQIERTTFLMRIPKENLMEAYMYPVRLAELRGINERWRVDTGAEAGSDLYLLRLSGDCCTRRSVEACRQCAA